MIKEPLKNKKYISDGIKGCTSFEISNAKDLAEAQAILKKVYFSEENVKSAVEWLREMFKTMSISTRSNDSCVNNIINQAFPDLVGDNRERTKEENK